MRPQRLSQLKPQVLSSLLQALAAWLLRPGSPSGAGPARLGASCCTPAVPSLWVAIRTTRSCPKRPPPQ